MYSINVNDKYKFEVVSENLNWDAVEVEPGRFNILLNNRSYSAVVLAADYVNKSFSVRIDSHVFSLSVKDRFDILAEQLGFSTKSAKKANEIKAPMPGMVLSVMVSEGQEVKMGESVLILEAMKMENVIKAPADCMIKHIKVKQGSAVEKSQVLIELA
jgi:biotin carboxyl carrier protein